MNGVKFWPQKPNAHSLSSPKNSNIGQCNFVGAKKCRGLGPTALRSQDSLRLLQVASQNASVCRLQYPASA